jgi:hypothetical protein
VPSPHTPTAARSDDLLNLVSELIDAHTGTVQLIMRGQPSELEWLAHCDHLGALQPPGARDARSPRPAHVNTTTWARHRGPAGHRCHSRLDGRPRPLARSRSCGSYAAAPPHRRSPRRRARVGLAPLCAASSLSLRLGRAADGRSHRGDRIVVIERSEGDLEVPSPPVESRMFVSGIPARCQ